MKKLFLLLAILVIGYGCNNNISKLASVSEDLTKETYILFMKESFAQPLINFAKDYPDRLVQVKSQESERSTLKKKLIDYLNSKNIRVDDEDIVVDVTVGAVLKLNHAEVARLHADSVNVDAVEKDVTVQIRPIQQTGPEGADPLQQWTTPYITDEIRPIQQSNDSLTRFDINVSDSTTKPIVAAGGASADTHSGKVIWFLDSGIDLDNPNLTVQTAWAAYFVNGVSSADDDFGHGTFCAGLAAGKPVGSPDRGLIHIGVSEGAWVVPVKVLDKDGIGAWSTVLKGLNHVARLGNADDVVNLSLGAYDAGNGNCLPRDIGNAIRKLCDRRRMFVTMSAGNYGGNAKFNMPGCVNGPNIFTASSINQDGSCAGYANFNQGVPLTDPVDYVTVGTRVFSLWSNGRFRMASGTSASSAILAGIIHATLGTPASAGPATCGRPYPIAKWR